MHRRSYYALGWLVYMVANMWLALLGEPGVTSTLFLSFLYTAGFMLSDVVADAIILECTTHESAADKGKMRTHAYYVRAIGKTPRSASRNVMGASERGKRLLLLLLLLERERESQRQREPEREREKSAVLSLLGPDASPKVACSLSVCLLSVGISLGSLGGALLFNSPKTGGTWSWGLSVSQLFWLQALVVLVGVLPLVPFMYELPICRKGVATDLRTMWKETFDFLSNDGVWIPLMYLYAYNFCYVSNPAWTNFLFLGLNFTNFGFGMLSFVGSVVGVFGILAYEKFFFKSA